MPYHELVREPLARWSAPQPSEVVAMNSLTVNLHLMMVSFYRPDARAPGDPDRGRRVPVRPPCGGVAGRASTASIPATDLIELEADEPDGTISMAAIERAHRRSTARASRWCCGPACSTAPGRRST